ncbi:MAG: hypothetical protein C4527_11530 [Candidatus Omnitrophota bacterium]|jgi:hypothetical protein|nr:MAG: hypothetical protein C4527_11530 [Candidatus Omnitrophota bacterium]
MMILCFYSVSIFLIGWLLCRYDRHEQTYRPFFQIPCRYAPLQSHFHAILTTILDFESFSERSVLDPPPQKLNYRDPDDPYHSIEDVLNWIPEQSRPANLLQMNDLIKAYYQLLYTFDLPDQFLVPVIEAVIHDLNEFPAYENKEITYKCIFPNQPVDVRTMQPINAGSLVRQPFGVVIYADGKVLTKARVLCD